MGYIEGRIEMTKYHVLMSESIAKTIVVEANSTAEAIAKVDNGDWHDHDVIKEKVIDRSAIDADPITQFDAHIRWTEELYLRWVNDYLCLDTFAEHYRWNRYASKYVLNAGRRINQMEKIKS